MPRITDEEVQQWIALFNQVNKECEETGETVVPLTKEEFDFDFYCQQVHNLTDEQDWDRAVEIVKVIERKLE